MSSENLPPDVIKRILKELKDINAHPLEDITLIPSDEDITTIDALIIGPKSTPYEGGYFKARLLLSSEFPRVPPKANFITKIFHPNVSKKGEICVNTLKKDWSEDLGIKHILITIKCLLIEPNADSALNEDASLLLLENYDDYCKHAKMFTSIHAKASALGDVNINSNVNNSSTTSESTTSNILTNNNNLSNIEANNKETTTKKKAVDTKIDNTKAKKSLKRL